MTNIYKKSLLTLTITAILVAGVFLMSPILVDAVKKQMCPSGKFMTGIDDKGNIICSTLPAAVEKAYSEFTFVTVDPATEGETQAQCDTGDIAMTGAFVTGTSDFLIRYFGPSGQGGGLVPGTGWDVRAQNIGSSSSTLSVIVYCKDLSPLRP